jgi:hypothetical protein
MMSMGAWYNMFGSCSGGEHRHPLGALEHADEVEEVVVVQVEHLPIRANPELAPHSAQVGELQEVELQRLPHAAVPVDDAVLHVHVFAAGGSRLEALGEVREGTSAQDVVFARIEHGNELGEVLAPGLRRQHAEVHVPVTEVLSEQGELRVQRLAPL